jgi:hypothetical protein
MRSSVRLDETSGAALLLTGLLAGPITSPLSDQVPTPPQSNDQTDPSPHGGMLDWTHIRRQTE